MNTNDINTTDDEDQFITLESCPVETEVDAEVTTEVDDEPQETQTQKPLTHEQEIFYKQSLYIALIDRYFEVNGLICYASNVRDGMFEFAFKHVETGDRYLVFSRLDQIVLDLVEQMEGNYRVIIDCADIKVDFNRCRKCESSWRIDSQLFAEAFDGGFYLLIDGYLFENKNDYYYCDSCWGQVIPPLAKSLRDSAACVQNPFPTKGKLQLPD